MCQTQDVHARMQLESWQVKLEELVQNTDQAELPEFMGDRCCENYQRMPRPLMEPCIPVGNAPEFEGDETSFGWQQLTLGGIVLHAVGVCPWRLWYTGTPEGLCTTRWTLQLLDFCYDYKVVES